MKRALAFLAFLLTTSVIHADESYPDPCEWGPPAAISVSDLKQIWDDPAPHNSCQHRCIAIYFKMFSLPFWYRDFVDSCTYYCATGRAVFNPNAHSQGLCKSEKDLKTYYASSVALELVWRMQNCMK